jgi:hypothetical protein
MAQMTIEEINHRLDTRPYFALGLESDTHPVLPDSVQQKFVNALSREIPENVLDSLVALTPEQQESLIKQIQRQDCKDDSICMQQKYKETLERRKEDIKRMYSKGIMPTKMILRAGNWQIKKSIPVLERAIGDEKYDQISVLMALAKLGNDSIKQSLIERYTLQYILKTTELDTVNNNFLYINTEKGNWQTIDLLYEAYGVAIYLKNKEILLNILDLIYIKGRDDSNISVSYTVSFLISDLYNCFNNYTNSDVLYKICRNYVSSIWNLECKKRNKKEQQQLQILLSTGYRAKIKMQLKDWIIENVNFE